MPLDGVKDGGGRCERCEDLEWEIRELKKQMAPQVSIPSEWGLTPIERAIFAALAGGRTLTFDGSEKLIMRDVGYEYRSNIVSVFICKMRKKLRASSGPEIVTLKRVGYRLDRKWEATDALAA